MKKSLFLFIFLFFSTATFSLPRTVRAAVCQFVLKQSVGQNGNIFYYCVDKVPTDCYQKNAACSCIPNQSNTACLPGVCGAPLPTGTYNPYKPCDCKLEQPIVGWGPPTCKPVGRANCAADEECFCKLHDEMFSNWCSGFCRLPGYIPNVSCILPDRKVGIDTALGCIPSIFGSIDEIKSLIGWLLGRIIALAGGIAFLLMLISGIMIIVSSGDPERVKAGQELFAAAVSGLLFIIFSIFILRIIGVEFLSIPGL